jgi:hypothetical protein
VTGVNDFRDDIPESKEAPILSDTQLDLLSRCSIFNGLSNNDPIPQNLLQTMKRYGFRASKQHRAKSSFSLLENANYSLQIIDKQVVGSVYHNSHFYAMVRIKIKNRGEYVHSNNLESHWIASPSSLIKIPARQVLDNLYATNSKG